MKRTSCNRCQRPLAGCLCAALPQQPIPNRWPLHILQHRQEKNHALNTAWIAGLGLVHCQLHAVTDAPVEETLSAALLEELANALLIYPGQQSRHVTHPDFAEMAKRPLLILDASWRKSRRLLLTSPWLQALPRISFDLHAPSRYRIRQQPAANYCSSLEAVCLVLGSLEQDHEKYKPLLAAMDLMIGKQLESMGEETFRRNYFSDERDDSQH